MSVQIARRSFTVAEYYRMAEAGILSEDDRVELLDGEVIEMSPIGSRHAACVDRLNKCLSGISKQHFIVRVQNPIRLDNYSEPQPDITLLRVRSDFYAEAHPKPDDVSVVIEVADSSVELDRQVKLPLYAQAEIPEFWLANLPNDTVEFYAQPVNGVYQVAKIFGRGETVTSQMVANLRIGVDEILG
jgi:Uma2 family endonuclease